MEKQRAIIVGGGIGGLATAVAFEKIGLDYIVLEQASEIKEVGAGITIWSNGVKCLKRLGLENQFKENSHHADSLVIYNHHGKILGKVSFSDFEATFGSAASTIHRADFINIFLKSVPSKKILLNKKVKSFVQDCNNISVVLTSGEKITGNILIGADGIHSVIRKGLGDNRELKYAGHTVWRGIIKAKSHISVPKSGMIVTGPKSIFGLTYCNTDKSYWFAQTVSHPEPTKDLKLNRLKQTFLNWPKSVQQIIYHTALSSIVRNDIMYLVPKNILGKGLCTLLGDAAHPCTPDLAQGACMAMEDAIELAYFLSKTSCCEKSLRLYERKRYVRTKKVVIESLYMGKLSQLENPILRNIRDFFYYLKIGSASVNSAMLKSIFKRYAKYQPPVLNPIKNSS